jgi:hypothetical protein
MAERNFVMVRAALRGETGGTALEHLLADRIATCWLAAYLAEVDAGFYAASVDGPFYDKRADRAHRRFLVAVESLAKVQRLMRPSPLMALAQVNIAQPGAQQLNMAQTGTRAAVGGAPE